LYKQVVSQCIAQQGDMLHHMGRMCFSLPDANDADYERKAKAAVEALLKDMEAAQLLQQADAASAACSGGASAEVGVWQNLSMFSASYYHQSTASSCK
jgi:hypothetical protein